VVDEDVDWRQATNDEDVNGHDMPLMRDNEPDEDDDGAPACLLACCTVAYPLVRAIQLVHVICVRHTSRKSRNVLPAAWGTVPRPGSACWEPEASSCHLSDAVPTPTIMQARWWRTWTR
jgi:hypothetical protein